MSFFNIPTDKREEIFDLQCTIADWHFYGKVWASLLIGSLFLAICLMLYWGSTMSYHDWCILIVATVLAVAISAANLFSCALKAHKALIQIQKICVWYVVSYEDTKKLLALYYPYSRG